MQTLSSSLRIGVLRGGPSPEYDVSLQSGSHVLKHLSETHQPVDIFISRDGTWHMRGVPRTPERILKQVDVVFNALHGSYGEDGQVQELLQRHAVPFTGSDRYASALAMNKWLTKERAQAVGIKAPLSAIVRENDSLAEKATEIFNSIPHPLIVKSVHSGPSRHAYVVQSYSELLLALESILFDHSSALVEEYVVGKQVSCDITESFRGQRTYAFPPSVQLIRKETTEIEQVAKKIHELLGLSHYSQSGFVVTPRRGIYFLEVSTTPKLYETSPLRQSLEAVGVSVKEFLHHLIALALNKKYE